MTEVEKIEKEIADAKTRLELARINEKNIKRNEAIKDLSEFTDEEKIKAFDSIFNSALGYVQSAEQDYRRDDDPNYGFEEFMGIIARNRDKFWKYYNSLD
jgi:hypothetical protein